MKRVYKEDLPINTINKIRNIIAELGILPIESVWNNPYKEIYSVRLELPKNDGGFGSNGKGRSVQYALASAYAEYIERMQNGYVMGVYGFNRMFLNKLKSKYGYYYFLDEQAITRDDMLNLPKEYVLDLLNGRNMDVSKAEIDTYFLRLNSNGLKGVTSVPFFDVKNKNFVYLPHNLTLMMTASNGMAAGNTNWECIFQGLCEILERFVATQIYYKQLTPPSVPREYLNTFVEERKIIEEIEKAGYIIDVKDFSCNANIPAVGVIIKNVETNKYKLNIGVDTSFAIALSRALTEIYQGLGSNKKFDDFMLSIPMEEHDYFKIETSDALARRSFEIKKFIINGLGVFPKSLFNEIPSYYFNKNVFTQHNDYKEEVEYLSNLLIRMGYNIYIRDVSFLGFPSCYIYVPKMSLLGRKSISDESNSRTLIENVEQDVLEDLLFPIEKLKGKDNIKKVLDILAPKRCDIYSGVKMQDLLRLEFESDFYWSMIPLNFFLAIFSYLANEYGNAKLYLSSFMKETSNDEDLYYNNIKKFFELKDLGYSDDEIRKNNLVEFEILDSFSDIITIFADVVWPNCPNCDACKLKEYCLTARKYNLVDRIMVKMQENYANSNFGSMYRDLLKINI